MWIPRSGYVNFALLIAAVTAVLSSGPTRGAETAKVFDIPSQDLGDALREFAHQSNRETLFAPYVVANKTSHEVNGSLSPDVALQRLLVGTGTVASESANGTILVAQAGSAGTRVTASSEPPAPATGNSSTDQQPVAANDTPVAKRMQTSNEAATEELGEIVVTANRREQAASKVGVSISAIGGDELSRLSLQEATQIVEHVPNMENSAIFGPGTQPNLAIRGVGMNDYNNASESPIAGYIDNVYMITPAIYSFPLFDMDRIEVLRGPQGTLFGRNSTAGAIQFLTHRPTNDLQASAGVEYGSFSTVKGDAMLNLPLVDQMLSVRISGHVQSNDGWLGNPSGLTGPGGELRTQDGRVQFLFRPTDEVTDIVRLYYDHASGNNYSQLHYPSSNAPDSRFGLPAANNTILPGGVNYYGTCAQCDAFGQPAAGWVNNVDNSPRLLFGGSYTFANELNWQIGTTTLTSVTGYNRYRNDFEQDCDGTPQPLCRSQYENTVRQISQELRAYIDMGPLRTTLGAYAMHQNVSGSVGINILANVELVPGHLGYLDYSQDQQNADGYAIFGNIEQDLGEQWTVTAGLRGAIDRKHINQTHGQYLDCPENPGFDDFLRAHAPLVSCGSLGPTGVFDDATANGSNSFRSTTWSGKIELDYKPIPEALIYLSESHGSKAAAFNNGDTSLSLFPQYGGTPGAFYVPPESVYATELGWKQRFLDGRIRMASDIFYYHYPAFDLLSVAGINSTILSKKARNYGAELDVTIIPYKGWSVDLDAGTARMRVDDVGNSFGLHATRDAPLDPHWNAGATLRYELSLGDLGSIGFQADAHARARMYAEADNFNDENLPSYVRTNLRLDYLAPGDALTISGYVNNVADRRDLANAIDLAGFGYTFATPMPPRWFGVQLSYKFAKH